MMQKPAFCQSPMQFECKHSYACLRSTTTSFMMLTPPGYLSMVAIILYLLTTPCTVLERAGTALESDAGLAAVTVSSALQCLPSYCSAGHLPCHARCISTAVICQKAACPIFLQLALKPMVAGFSGAGGGNEDDCSRYFKNGGWGPPTDEPWTDFKIPNKGVYIANNLVYNPPGYGEQARGVLPCMKRLLWDPAG
jgi:hypothetical protein